MLLASTALYRVASVLCGLSQYMTMLVTLRALQGLAAGAMSVTTSALVGDVVPLRHRGHYQGILGAVFRIGTVAGPLAGGYLTDVAAPIVSAYDQSLTQGFLWAGVVGLSGSCWRCSCVRPRCGRSTTPPATSVTGSACRAPNHRKRCWKPRCGACCTTHRMSVCAASPRNPAVGSMSPNCGACCAFTNKTGCSGRRS
ncbi:hypothetical protein BST45_12210 [Mycobacterium shinjukuense]|nr:hypothetical protein BST45_12210 [Mycobacterium shinjukuense]